MKVALDASCLNRDYVRGMGKYVWNVLSHAKDSDIEWQLYGDRYDFPTHVPEKTNINMEVFELPGHRFHSWEQLGLPYRARRSRADVLHCTATSLPWWQPLPTVVTIHDTVPFDVTEEGCQDRWYWKRLLPRCYHKAAAIITISESSRRDILRLWPKLEPKLHVIRHGIDQAYLDIQPAPLPTSLAEEGLRAPYLLYFGGEIARKRVDWALQIFEKLQIPDLQLVICGFGQESLERLTAKIPAEIRDRVCIPSFIAESDMPALYQNAIALLYPTLYEGFGLPAVEAQATGTPAIFSRVGSLEELEGPGAIVLPQDDLNSWVDACRELVKLRSEQPAPQEDSRMWARNFSWEKSARKHLDVYRQVGKRSPSHTLQNDRD